MLTTRLAAVLMAAAIGAIGIGIAPETAPAVPRFGNLPDIAESDPNIQRAHKIGRPHKHVRRWVYVPRKHGKRWRYKRPGYVYYYGGWWYPRPWWRVEPGIFVCIGC